MLRRCLLHSNDLPSVCIYLETSPGCKGVLQGSGNVLLCYRFYIIDTVERLIFFVFFAWCVRCL